MSMIVRPNRRNRVSALGAAVAAISLLTGVSFGQVPQNDLCTNATVLDQFPATYTIPCNQATNDSVLLPCADDPSMHTYNGIWFSYNPPVSCLLTTQVGSSFVAVFDATGGCNNLGTPLLCGYPNIQLQGGTPYLIYVARAFASTQPDDAYNLTFSIFTPPAPPNDLCNSAIEIDAENLPAIDSQMVGGAGNDPYIAVCSLDSALGRGRTSSNNGIWYHIVNGNSYCRLQVDMTGYIMASAVYTGPCTALQEVYCEVNRNTFVMRPNMGYYILFYGLTYAGPNDVFTVSFTGCTPTTHNPPPNDHCDQAIVIPDGLYSSTAPYANAQFVQSADRDAIMTTTTCKFYQNNSIWYTYTPSQPVRILIKETSFTDAAWVLFSGSCSNLTGVLCKSSDTSNNNFADLKPCVPYYICMYNEATSDFNAEMSLNISIVTTQNGACQIGTTCTYVTGAGSCAGTFMGAGSICANNSCCPADFNGDHVRDVADLFGYINAWLAKAANADFNHDTVVDVADLFGFINAWLAGC